MCIFFLIIFPSFQNIKPCNNSTVTETDSDDLHLWIFREATTHLVFYHLRYIIFYELRFHRCINLYNLSYIFGYISICQPLVNSFFFFDNFFFLPAIYLFCSLSYFLGSLSFFSLGICEWYVQAESTSRFSLMHFVFIFFVTRFKIHSVNTSGGRRKKSFKKTAQIMVNLK